MQGKIITIEGTDRSGKGTQTKLIYERLKKENYKVEMISFPRYETATGKIVGGPYLGKTHIGEGLFPEGAANVDPYVASAYFAADRKYATPYMEKLLNDGYILILDRYVESNLGHQGGKEFDKEKRKQFYDDMIKYEYEINKIPRPTATIFLHMPYEYTMKLAQTREEGSDQHEMSKEHLINAEKAYLELAEILKFDKIECIKNNEIRSIEDVHEEIYNKVMNIIK